MNTRYSIGWAAITISTIFSVLWGFWGIIENFHEGWYFNDLFSNIMMMFGQYLLISLVFMLLGIIGVFFHKTASVIFIIIAVLLAIYFGVSRAATLIIVPPMLIISFLFWLSEFNRKMLALWIIVGAPVLTMFIFGAEPAYRVSQRVDDGDYSELFLEENDKILIFAPEGPGWTNDGTNWFDANLICSRLNLDGMTLSDSAVNIWRLPTLEELVAFSQRDGENCGGTLDKSTMTPSYKTVPDKESPLWKVHSKIIYWWAADEKDSVTAYKYVYNGQIYETPKKSRWGYLGFRAVRDCK